MLKTYSVRGRADIPPYCKAARRRAGGLLLQRRKIDEFILAPTIASFLPLAAFVLGLSAPALSTGLSHSSGAAHH
jgi:hypothetical protein